MTATGPARSFSPQDILGSAPDDWQGRPLWAEIDLDALTHNVRGLANRAGQARLLAVVKANAYGHGAVPIATAALDAGAQALGVICVDEGAQLRAAGITAPILVMGHTSLRQAGEAVANGLTPTVNSYQFGLALSAHAAEAGVRVPVQIKVDTGMARYGSTADECVELATALRDLPGIEVEGIYTHFASADEPDKSFALEQYANLMRTCERLPWVPLRHAAASAALLELPHLAMDMVRTGIAIYGYAPGKTDGGLGLRPVLSLKSRLARIHELAPGETVSYGRTWRATQRTVVGLVMAGYADGVPRLLSNRGSVLVRGRRVPIIGRVCMDQLIVDLTAVPEAQVDDIVVLIGRQGDERIDANEMAALSETISYEILTGISARVPRLFVRDGRVERVQTLNEEAGAAPTPVT